MLSIRKISPFFIILSLKLFSLLPVPDFDQSMLRQGLRLEELNVDFNEVGQKIYGERNQEILSFFRELYYKNIQEAAQFPEVKDRIPRIVHQIWLGGPVPNEFRHWMDTWRNQGWEYKLWTDAEIAKLKMRNKALYDLAENYGEKSDIVRLEILYQYGGLYVDTDFECLNIEIFNDLHRGFDFYIGFEPLEHGFTNKFNMNKFCNALIGSAIGHPLMHDFIENIQANYLAYRKCCTAIQRTGPSYLTRIIWEFEAAGTHNNRNLYLPCTFFYPISDPEVRKATCFELWVPNETAGIHYWYGSWHRNFGSEFNPFEAIRVNYTSEDQK